MKLGLLARADCGGLGSLTWDFAQALAPLDRIVIVNMGAGGHRGPFLPDRYAGLAAEVLTVEYPIADPTPLLAGLDVLYTAEVPYGPHLLARARAMSVRVVLHAMTELWRPEYAQAAEVWVPTPWATDSLAADCAAAGTPWRVMPVPVAVHRFAHRPRHALARALHIAAPAMLDRNGTELVAEAYRHTPGLPPLAARHVPVPLRRLGWDVLRPAFTHYDAYPDSVDLLVLPRRYAGLSLPVQEAAACGIPALMLDRAPERTWPGVVAIPVTGGSPARMAGGTFTVWQANPTDLARQLLALRSEPAVIAALSAAARAWAESLSWEAWAPRYREALAGNFRV